MGGSTDDVVALFDKDSDGDVERDEFVAIFNEIDADGDGDIEIDELRAAFQKVDVRFSDAKLEAMIRLADKDGSGSVSKKEFSRFFAEFAPAPAPAGAGTGDGDRGGGMGGHSLVTLGSHWENVVELDIGSEYGALSASSAPCGPPPKEALLAGGVAGVVSRTVTHPLERVKLLTQTGQNHAASSKGTFRAIVRSEGVLALWRGNTAGVARAFPFAGMVCLAYTQALSMLPLAQTTFGDVPYRIVAGTLAGGLATTITYPLDLVKAKLSVQKGARSERKYKGMGDALRSIVRHDGVGGLFRGIRPTLVAMSSFIAVQQCSYDVMKDLYLNGGQGRKPSSAQFLITGALAGLLAQTCIYPLDVWRRRVQTETIRWNRGKPRISTWAAVRSIWQHEGVRGSFGGIGVSYLKVAPSVAVTLWVRDAMLGRLST